eukprot:1297294-Karenia_brevis.AAC.1
MREPLGAQEPEPCTSKNLWERKQQGLWEGSQSLAEGNERTFGRAGGVLHKQTRRPLGRQS